MISTYDKEGGAAIAARRLHRGLVRAGADSAMIVRHRASEEDAVLAPLEEEAAGSPPQELFWMDCIQERCIDARRTGLSNTYFSLAYPGWDLSGLPSLVDADVVNLHWVARFLSPVSLQRVFSLGKPVVWTLHDQNPFTGGCHYSAGCEGYRSECAGCPQLQDDPFDLAKVILRDKTELFRGAAPVIVTPSRWLAECAAASSLFNGLRIETIPNGIDTEAFKPGDKSLARERFGIDQEAFVVLFSAANIRESRKNLDALCEGLDRCLKNEAFRDLAAGGKVRVMVFGSGSDEVEKRLDLPVSGLGYLTRDEEVSDAYSAADVFVLTSLEDNLPNTVMESMACGTPPVAFEVGGVPDMVEDGVTGRLIAPGDTRALTKAVLDLALHPGLRARLGESCRGAVLERFALERQAAAYLSLFEDLLRRRGRAGRPVAAGGDGLVRRSGGPVLLTEKGRHFEEVYDAILLQALKDVAPDLRGRLLRSEAERGALLESARAAADEVRRLQSVNEEIDRDRQERLELIKLLEGQKTELWQEVQKIEAERDRLEDGLHSSGKILGEMREEIEKSHARCEFLSSEQERYRKELEALRKKTGINRRRWSELLQSAEATRGEMDRLIEEISSLQEEVSVPVRRALLAHKPFAELHGLLADTGFWLDPGEESPMLERYFHLLNCIYLASLRLAKAVEKGTPLPDCREPAAMDSPIVEALSFARTLDGDLEERAMEFLFECASRLKSVLIVNASPRNLQAACIMAGAGAKVTVLGAPVWVLERKDDLRVEAEKRPLGEWLARKGPDGLAAFDCLVCDNELGGRDARLLKGRLRRENLIVHTGGGQAGEDLVFGQDENARVFHGVRVFETAPARWLDPLGSDWLQHAWRNWPSGMPGRALPERMPSGNPWPRISVVTVTLNQGVYLEETLRSVLMQGYPNLEYIVVDGGSVDTTPSILGRYRDRLAHCLSEPDKGQSDALNKGFRLATGDILAWLNSDDRYLPGALVRVAMAFDHYETDVVAGGCALVRGFEKEPFHRHHNFLPVGEVVPLPAGRLLDVDGAWQKGDFFFQPEVFWSREMWLKSGGRIDESLYYSMDYELWVRMAFAGCRILHIPDALALFRLHGEQKTSGDLPFLEELRQVSRKYREGRR